MSQKPKPRGGVGERGLGMELRRYREKAGLSLEKVGAVLNWSANTMSRLERGLRADTTTDEVSAILAAIQVTGPDRDRLMRMAAGQAEHGWWEHTNVRGQAHTYPAFEKKARRMVNVEPLLVPGLLQTQAYTHALLLAFGVNKSRIPGTIARRVDRQELLTRRWDPPELVFIMCELSLRQPFGGHAVMAEQLRHIAEQADLPNVSVRVIPASVAAHPALAGAFVMLEFPDEPTVVCIESRRTAMFPESSDAIEDYRLTVERSTDLALAEQESQVLLRAIAEDMERAR